ncbi:unnamed protein product [Paramecium sonneborni]|uniref:Uncharacterized protein n=1 Tax=Paramecium sonneborni TaxID=65129 RepID=A0A8S1NRG3_9CILI|nr:unnamed protein product [Paramecium sonneborni]
MSSSTFRKRRNNLQASMPVDQPQQFEEETQQLSQNINSRQHFYDYSQRIQTIDKFLKDLQKLKQMSFYKN